MQRWTVHLRGGPAGGEHAAVAVGHKVYCFEAHSGQEADAYSKGQVDVRVFNTVFLRWAPSAPPAAAGRGERPLEVPSYRVGYTAVRIDDVIYVWGGWTDTGEYCNVLYAFDVDAHRWSPREVSGSVPEARCGHSACASGRAMYVYAGYNKLTGRANDICKLDATTMVWSSISNGGTAAPASSWHSATIIGTKMFVFGGRGDRDNDHTHIRVFDTEANRWLSTPSAQPLPERRWCHSAFAHNGELYVVDGRDSDRIFNDLWKFTPGTFSWNKVVSKGKGPCGMTNICCCAVRDRVVLLGGYVDETVPGDDLYILDLSPSLKTLCKLEVLQCDLEQSELPHDIMWELAAMTTNT